LPFPKKIPVALETCLGDGYSVCGVYKLFISQNFHSFDAASDLIWHKQVPLGSVWIDGRLQNGAEWNITE